MEGDTHSGIALVVQLSLTGTLAQGLPLWQVAAFVQGIDKSMNKVHCLLRAAPILPHHPVHPLP